MLSLAWVFLVFLAVIVLLVVVDTWFFAKRSDEQQARCERFSRLEKK